MVLSKRYISPYETFHMELKKIKFKIKLKNTFDFCLKRAGQNSSFYVHCCQNNILIRISFRIPK